MKRIVLVIAFVSFCIIYWAGCAFAVSPAMDWVWCFTEVRDENGNVLASRNGPTSDPLLINIDPSTGRLKFYAEIFSNQALNSSNIEFVGTRTYGTKAGGDPSDFYDVYGISTFYPWTLNGKLPLSADQGYGPFWIYDVYLKDINNPVPDGDYSIFNSTIDIYDLQEPLNQFGRHTLYSIGAGNDIRWSVGSEQVVPEVSPLLLISIGSMVLAFIKRKI